IEPRATAPHDFDGERAGFEVAAVYVGDLELTARRGLQLADNVVHALIVEVEPGDGVTRLGFARLLLDGDRAPAPIEFDDAIAFGILHRIGENRRALRVRRRALQHR